MSKVDWRALREEQIDAIADALGDESEWTSLSDRGNNAIEAAHAVVAKRDSLRKRIAELEAEAAAGTRFDERAANMYAALCAIYPVYRAAVAYLCQMRRTDKESATGLYGRLLDQIDSAHRAFTPDLVAALKAMGLEES